MKKISCLLILSFVFACAEKKSLVVDNSIISQKRSDSKEIQLVLNSVSNDSRCPEETNCIWAGEVTIGISVYEGSKIIETKSMLVASKNQKQNSEWFQKYFTTQKIKSFSVLPYPKSKVVINPQDYFIKMIFE